MLGKHLSTQLRTNAQLWDGGNFGVFTERNNAGLADFTKRDRGRSRNVSSELLLADRLSGKRRLELIDFLILCTVCFELSLAYFALKSDQGNKYDVLQRVAL